jgi:DNA-binding CsgD family transcriptional regulator/tetratricopeptide (TPR) repeat protein
MTLWGRGAQCGHLDGLLAEVRAGRSRALVVRGEPGIGKTALLRYAADTAPDFQVARAEGVESEMELPFAALHQLCGRMLGRLDRLPGPQCEALGVAFGLRSGNAPDRFLVGLAVLGLLGEVAAEQPLLCLVDDAQWLDQASAQALAFVARRLDAESVAAVFGTRSPGAGGELAGVRELALEGLSDADARALLGTVIPGRLDERVRDRIVAECAGNPLALLELPRGVTTTAELAGGFGVAGPLPLAGRIEQSFLRQIAPLPVTTQRLLLLAAAEPTGDPALLWRAAERLGISVDAAGPAETVGLLTIAAQVTFRHPLVRSALYQAASASDRRRVHMAVAEAIDPVTDPDRRAWHRAQVAAEPDEDIAAELDRSASRAQARGGLAAAAAFLQRSAALTPEPGLRAKRALAAAHAQYDAGMPDAAIELLAIAAEGPLGDLDRARSERLHAQIAFTRLRGSTAPSLLLQAARRLAPLDAALSRETYLEALWSAIRVGQSGGGPSVDDMAQAALAAPPAAQPPRAVDLLLDGLVERSTKGYASAVPTLERALSALCDEDGPSDVRWLWLGCHTAMDLWDDGTCLALGVRHAQKARATGALTMLPIALNYVAAHHIFAGEFAAAEAMIDEADVITAATGNVRMADFSLLLAGWRGHTSSQFDSVIQDAAARGEGLAMASAEFATAVLHNGLGQYESALVAAQQACEHDQLGFGIWVLPELIEAAVRLGQQQLGADGLLLLTERTSLSRSVWAHAIEARCRALLTDGKAAEDLYKQAISQLRGSKMTVQLARAHLLYGEWLHHANRRPDAREQLRVAHQMFVSMGAEGFAERAARGLRATGERVGNRSTDIPAQLSVREIQIAQLAEVGLTNPEIAAQLFMSRRTVEYHLTKIFAKLAISTRNQIHGALTNVGTEGRRLTP